MSHSWKLLVSTALVAGFAAAVSPGASASVTLPGSCIIGCEEGGIADVMILHFDENGHGTIAENGGPTITLTGTLMLDPSIGGGVPTMVLTYLLPEAVVAGDVSFAEPGGGISDWLRFTDAKGNITGATGAGSRMIFYSGVGDSDLADTGFNPNLGTGNTFAAKEVGPEGSNGFDYRPGGVPYPLNNEYIGISDVPEPATLALLGVGLLGLGLVRRPRG